MEKPKTETNFGGHNSASWSRICKKIHRTDLPHLSAQLRDLKNSQKHENQETRFEKSKQHYAHMQILVVQILVNLKWFFGHSSAPRSRIGLTIGGNSSQ